MFRKHHFDTWLMNCSRRLQYVYRSFRTGCRMSYRFGDLLYLKVKQGANFVIRIYNATNNALLGVVHDDGKVYQCV